MKKVAILGAGNGGLSMGAHMALSGWEVSLYDAFEKQLEGVRKAGGIRLSGPSSSGFAHVGTVTDQIREALEGCPLVMVTTPAFAHRDLAEKCAPFLRHGQIVLLNPGRTCGALEFRKRAEEVFPEARFTVAEAQSLVYACRRTGPAEATIYQVKDRVPLAAFPASDTPRVLEALAQPYPQFSAASDVLETSLMNIGAIFHPGPAMLNIARIENREDFDYYTDGISPCVGSVLELVDRERVAVAGALGVPTLSCRDWLGMAYGIEIGRDDTIYSAVQKNPAYRGIRAPGDPYARYITEDVPMSLVPLSELGRLSGTPTPAMDLLISLAGMLHGRDYRKSGRTAKKLGIEGLSPAALKRFVRTGHIGNGAE